MASNRNFDGHRFLVGSSLVGAKGFLKSQGAYLGSAISIVGKITKYPPMALESKFLKNLMLLHITFHGQFKKTKIKKIRPASPSDSSVPVKKKVT